MTDKLLESLIMAAIIAVALMMALNACAPRQDWGALAQGVGKVREHK